MYYSIGSSVLGKWVQGWQLGDWPLSVIFSYLHPSMRLSRAWRRRCVF